MRCSRYLLILCTVFFLSLCFLHYFSCRPLWLDENFILENIKGLKVPEILGPLSNSQVFPRMYLMAISKFAEQFIYDPLALRLFPLLSMFLAFFVWLKVYSIEIADKWGALLAVLSIACSYSFSYYAAELKHYSMDLLVAGIFCLYFINQRELTARAPSKGFIFFTLVLPFTILVSYSSFFLFWIVIYNFFLISSRDARLTGVLCLYTLLSLVFLTFVYYFDMRHTLSTGPLFSYWDDYFISTSSFGSFISSISEGVRKLTTLWFGKGKIFIRFASVLIPLFVLPLFIGGIKALKRSKFKVWDIDSIGLVIFIELFILGILKKYPFTGGRITLFYAPFVLYFIIKGITYLKVNRWLYFVSNAYYVTFLLLCGLNSLITYSKLYLP